MVTDTVLGTLDSLGAGELNPGELARYKERIALGTAARWQTNDEVMRWMQNLMIGGYSPQDLGMAEAIYKISPESIAEVLAPCVGYESVVWTGPLEAMER